MWNVVQTVLSRMFSKYMWLQLSFSNVHSFHFNLNFNTCHAPHINLASPFGIFDCSPEHVGTYWNADKWNIISHFKIIIECFICIQWGLIFTTTSTVQHKATAASFIIISWTLKWNVNLSKADYLTSHQIIFVKVFRLQ